MLKYPSSNVRLWSNLKRLGLEFKDGTKLASALCRSARFELRVSSGKNLALNTLDPALFCFWNCVAESPDSLCKAVERFKVSDTSIKRYERYLEQVHSPPAVLEDSNKTAFRVLAVNQHENWDSKKLIRKIEKTHKKVVDSLIFYMECKNFIDQDSLNDFTFFFDHPEYDEDLPEILSEKKFLLVCEDDDRIHAKYHWANINKVGEELVVWK